MHIKMPKAFLTDLRILWIALLHPHKEGAEAVHTLKDIGRVTLYRDHRLKRGSLEALTV